MFTPKSVGGISGVDDEEQLVCDEDEKDDEDELDEIPVEEAIDEKLAEDELETLSETLPAAE